MASADVLGLKSLQFLASWDLSLALDSFMSCSSILYMPRARLSNLYKIGMFLHWCSRRPTRKSNPVISIVCP